MRLSQIAKDYSLKLTGLTKRNLKDILRKYDLERYEVKNNAFLIDDHIILGFYDDPELKQAAFFHELGHSLVTERFEKLVNYDELLIEYQAWIEGLKVAKKYRYEFRPKVFKYILNSTNSYYKDAIRAYRKKPKRKKTGN